MAFSADFPEGMPLDQQFRAMALAAALERRCGMFVERSAYAAHSLRLLSPGDQLSLVVGAGKASRGHKELPQPISIGESEGREAQQAGASSWLFLLRPKAAIAPQQPLQGSLIVLDGAPTQAQLYGCGMARAYAWTGGEALPALLGSGGPRGAVALERAVAACMLGPRGALQAAGTEAGQAGQPAVLVLMTAAASDRNLLAALRTLPGLGSVLAFDPYGVPEQAGIGGTYGPREPALRLALYRAADVLVVGSATDANNNAFVDEALATGLGVLPAAKLLPPGQTAAPATAGWLDLLRRTRAEAPQQAQAAGPFVSYEQVAARLQQDVAAAPPVGLLATAQGPCGAALLAGSAVELTELVRAAPRPPGPCALLLLGSDVSELPSLRALARSSGYDAVVVVLSEQAAAGAQLVSEAMLARMRSGALSMPALIGCEHEAASIDAAITWLLQGEGRQTLHVLASNAAPLAGARAWQQLQAALAAGPGSARARVVVEGKRPARERLVATAKIGAQVAGLDLIRGYLLGTGPRTRSKWFDRDSQHVSAKRTIMPPWSSALAPNRLADVHAGSSDTIGVDAFRQALQADQVDAILGLTGPFVSNLLAARNAWATRPVPICSVLHSIHGLSFSVELLRQQTLATWGPADAFISPSECGKQAALRQWQALASHLGRPQAPLPDIDVVPYGVDTAFFRGRERQAARLAQALPMDAPIFLQLGRFNRREKGCTVPLLLAFAEVVRQAPDAQLMLAGKAQADEQQRLLTLVAELGLAGNVELRSDVPAEHKAQLLAAADAFVCVSDNVQETYGLALIEAMAAGLPVIAPAWNGFRELVVHGETGLLVPCHWCEVPSERALANTVIEGFTGYGWRDLHETTAVDIEALREAMLTLLAHPEARANMGRAGSARAAAGHDIAGQGRRLGEVVCARAERAARLPRLALPRPYFDDIGRSFAHYTSSVLSAQTLVEATARSRSAAWRKAVFRSMDLGSKGEEGAIEGAIEQARGQAVPLGQLARGQLDHLRLLRCLKYGLLALAPPPSSPGPLAPLAQPHHRDLPAPGG